MGYPVQLEDVSTDTLIGLAHDRGQKLVPRVVCLCGSTRFMDAFAEANRVETLSGKIVLTVGVTKSDAPQGIDQSTKDALDALHKRKIDLADEILVLNVGGYVGESTRSEIAYAQNNGKLVRWWERWEPVTDALLDPHDFVEKAANDGLRIVSTNDVDEDVIRAARNDGRMCVASNGFGWVLLS